MGTPSVDLQITDTGKLLVTVDAVDADGVKTAWPSGAAQPAVGETDPAGFTGPFFVFGAPVATATGFTLEGTVDQTKVSGLTTLPTGITLAVSVASGFPNQTAPITQPLTPAVDIVAGPAATFVAAESAE